MKHLGIYVHVLALTLFRILEEGPVMMCWSSVTPTRRTQHKRTSREVRTFRLARGKRKVGKHEQQTNFGVIQAVLNPKDREDEYRKIEG